VWGEIADAQGCDHAFMGGSGRCGVVGPLACAAMTIAMVDPAMARFVCGGEAMYALWRR